MKKTLLLVLFLCLGSITLMAQSYNMTVTGHQEQTSGNCTIYDDGGETGNYSGNCNSSITIVANNSNNYFYITGTYNLESCAKARLKIFDGGTMSTVLLNTFCNSGSISLCTSGPRVTIRFESDTDTPLSGFVINCVENPCPRPSLTYSNNITSTSGRIGWSGGTASTNWIVECTTNNMPDGQNTFTTNNNFMDFTGLEPLTTYCFRIRSDCTPLTPCSYALVCFTTLCPCPPPTNIVAEMLDSTTLRVDWTESNTEILWTVEFIPMNGDPTITVQTNNPYYVFENLPFPYNCYRIKIFGPCPGTELICNQASLIVSCPPPPPFECDCPVAINPRVVDYSISSAYISWVHIASPGWIIKYYPIDDITNTIIDTVNTNSFMATNLEPATYYIFEIHSYCDSFDIRCVSKIGVFTYNDKCFDFLDLRGPNCTTTFGNYENPDLYRGLIDLGEESIISRHVIHKDTLGKDPRTNNRLSTVQPGKFASVRLGNWNVGAEAESITYQYMIDTNNFDLMILNYAIVLQDPNHTLSNQPRFTLSIFGENGRILDQFCGYTNFYASGELGWDTATTSFGSVIWKDWTTMGVDLAQYHGQRIAIKLTTYDCEEGGHFGYAYFNLDCERKDEIQSSCGDVDSITLTAPNGFNYVWYEEGDETNIISRERQIRVLVDNSVFYCKCISKESEYCFILMKYIAERTYPYAQFTYDVNRCTREVTFINTSIISNRATYPSGYKPVDSIQWKFHNDSISTNDTVVLTFDSVGVYEVRLIASIAEGGCNDTIIQQIIIEPFYVDTIHAEICAGEVYDDFGFEETVQGVYPVIYTTDEGCDSIIVLDLIVKEKYELVIYDTICEGDSYTMNGFNCSQPNTYIQELQTYNGCDSTVTLHLSLKKLFDDFTILDENYIETESYPIYVDGTCEGCLSYFWNTGSTNPILQVNYPGSYFLSVYTDCGTIYDSVEVVSPEVVLFLPNSFTPTLDKNNTFFPIYEDKEYVHIQLFEIFNRWGERVYSSTTQPWDGRYKNNLLPMGTYVWQLIYKLKFSGEIIYHKSGSVNLIR